MKAMVMNKICDLSEDKTPLKMVDLPDPVPRDHEILIRVSACGVCHTELDEIEGRTPPATLPMVLGHQVVGRVIEKGDRVVIIDDVISTGGTMRALLKALSIAGAEVTDVCFAIQRGDPDIGRPYKSLVKIEVDKKVRVVERYL